MRIGRDFGELVTELERQHDAKRDFLLPSNALHVQIGVEDGESGLLDTLISDARDRQKKKRTTTNGVAEHDGLIPQLHFDMRDQGTSEILDRVFSMTPHAHRQMAGRLDIPQNYYTRMLLPENRDLYLESVNHWLQQSIARRLIRTLDGRCRADLSDAYRDLDNYDLITAILPPIMDAGCRLLSCEVTDTKLYVKVLSPGLEGEIGTAAQHKIHHVNGGLVISNSEIGMGRLQLEGLLHVTACSNGMWTGTSFKKTHLGRRLGADLDEAREWFTDRTKQLDDAAFFSKAGDVVKGMLSNDAFQGTLAKLNGVAEEAPVQDPVQAIEVVRKNYDWTDGEAVKIRNTWISQGADFGLGRWGLTQAITQVAQDEELTYDRASDLERQAGEVIELGKQDWGKAREAIAV